MASRASKIAKRTLVGGTLAVVLGLFLREAYWSPSGFVVWAGAAVLGAGCIYEVGRMSSYIPRGVRLPLWFGWLLALSPGALVYLGIEDRIGFDIYPAYPSAANAALGYAVAFLGVVLAGLVMGAGLRNIRRLAFLALWLPAPLVSLAAIWAAFGPNGLLALILLSKIGDVFGYYVGNALGKSHPFPKTSPGKTTAGCVASLIAGTLGGGLCAWFELLPGGRDALVPGLAAGALINLAAQAGDLLESRVKRAAGVKDSGTWFGPSGGVLDLVDSLLLAVPAALLTWPWLFA